MRAAGGGGVAEAEPLRVGQAAAAAAGGAEEAPPPAEWTMEIAMERGEAGYKTYCAACHQPGGEGLPPAFPALTGEGVSADKSKAGEHLEVVVNGKAGTAMAAFDYLSDADLAAIVTYERNAWGNGTGQLVTPDDVKAAR